MKNLTKLILLMSACLLIVSCGAPKTPKDVVKIMFVAIQNLDFATMKKHLASERLSRLEQEEQDMKENPNDAADFILKIKDAKIEIISEKISEDKNSASVVIKISQVKGEYDSFENSVNLIKENGEWKFDENAL
ncbi:MAG: DUF4878 domain-containing protein [Prevotellaceae bacterium]|jgi:ABC-type transporter MlaC component|nr:DUF4878 domain-containing protein [Prevotellaceae bacterium]